MKKEIMTMWDKAGTPATIAEDAAGRVYVSINGGEMKQQMNAEKAVRLLKIAGFTR